MRSSEGPRRPGGAEEDTFKQTELKEKGEDFLWGGWDERSEWERRLSSRMKSAVVCVETGILLWIHVDKINRKKVFSKSLKKIREFCCFLIQIFSIVYFLLHKESKWKQFPTCSDVKPEETKRLNMIGILTWRKKTNLYILITSLHCKNELLDQWTKALSFVTIQYICFTKLDFWIE